MFEKFTRSWELTKASAEVLRSDKELLLFPVISSLAALLVAATFLVPIFGLHLFEGGQIGPLGFVVGFLFYVCQYFVIFYFNVALVGAAMIRLEGGDPTVGDGLRIARSKAGAILGYAAIAATVGIILKAVEKRAGFLGRIVIGLVGAAWTVATFMVVPVLVAATFLIPIFGLRLFEGDHMGPLGFVVGFLFYVCQYFVIFYFNVALVGAAMIRLEGGDPTVADGLRIAKSRAGAILGYAAIAATVGIILKAIEERAGFIGRIVIGLVGAAWTVATFMVVPVLVAQDVGPMEAVKESVSLLKKTWGENIIGTGGIGIVFALIIFAVLIVGFVAVIAAAAISPYLAITIAVILVLAVLLIGVIQAALAGIYSAALYRYAVDGQAPAGFGGDTLQLAFKPK